MGNFVRLIGKVATFNLIPFTVVLYIRGDTMPIAPIVGILMGLSVFAGWHE